MKYFGKTFYDLGLEQRCIVGEYLQGMGVPINTELYKNHIVRMLGQLEMHDFKVETGHELEIEAGEFVCRKRKQCSFE